MDIKELEDYRLSDAVKFHTHLNPRIWGTDEHLLPEVREKLLAIAADFKEFLGLDLEVKDITISGSNAAYTYTDHSDIDLHLVADLPKADIGELYRELFDAKKYQYNDQHNFTIGGYPVELYVQNANQDHKSQGIYSVLNNNWVSVPKRRKPDIDDISVKSKYEDLGNRIEAAIKSGDVKQLEQLGSKVREFRQAGLDQTGEFGPENLAFKVLRSNGTLDRLRAARQAAKNQELSIDETREKIPFKYGFKTQKPMEDWHPNEEPPGPESKPEMPAGTVMVDVSDVYDWYKLGQDISDLDHADPKMYGQGAPQTIINFGSEDLEHKYIKKLEKLGLKTHDIDPSGKKLDRETEFRVNESADNIQTQLEKFAAFCSERLGIENPPRIQLKKDPEWSKRNATFGRYMPEVETLVLSVANRHPMDIMRTLAHELVHRRQDEIEPMPGHAGDTGSKWENEANARAGVLMRDWGAKNPGMFDKKPLGEGTESNIDWVKPNFDYEWDEIEFQAKQPQVPADVRNYMAKYFPNKQAWMKSVQQGKSVVMPPNHGQKIRNYTDNKQDLLHALSPASHDPEGPAKEKRVNALFDKGGPIEMPIILKTSEGLWLIGGKTRLGTANLLKGIPAKVWLIGGQQVVAEASGYIPVNKKEAKDPRYSMAITVDIKPGEVKRQAAKMGWKTNPAGTPPTARTNGLVESLQRKLDQVKAETLTEEQLDEVNMSPGALQSWAKEHAAGMKSGFEAELIFKDLLKDADDEEDEDDGDMEPDYDQDEQADDIDDVLEFFSSELTTRERNRLSDEMYTNYREWYDEAVLEAFEDRARWLVKEYLEENKWDWQDKIAEYLQDTLGKTQEESDVIMNQGQENDDGSDNPDYVFAQREVEDQFDKLVEQTVSEGFDNDNYQAAYDEFARDFDGRTERDWLRTQGIRNMSDVSNEYSIDWPHWRPVGRERDEFADGNYHSSYAEMLANRLKETLGVKTQVESGTRGASAKRRTPSDVWVFEADGSLNADARTDMPVEIVSPPMPLEQTLEIMPKFFEWAASQGAYANRSTGLHMSVSMPEHAGDNLDYAKAALFLGDQYVLEQFGRTAQSYCQSALKEIKKRIDQRRKNLIPADNEVTKAFNQMREKLNALATKAFAQPSGYGKYYSINPKEKYIEFRSAGGKDYIKDVPKLQNTMLRYARAMSIGMDPAAEKAEYAKKLYKLLGNVELQQNPADTTFGPTNKKTSGSVSAKSDKKDGIWYFTRYAAGELTKSDLKQFVKQMQGEREAIKRVRSADKMWWKVYQAAYGPSDGPQIEVVARNPTEAVAVARKEWGITSATHRGFTDNDFVAEPLRPLTPAEIEQTRAQFEPQAPAPDDSRFAYDPESNPTGNYVIRRRDPDSNTPTGPVIYRFRGDDASDAVDQARGWMMRRGIGRSEIWLATSESTPEAILNAVPPAPSAPAGDRFAYDTNSNPEGNYVIRRRDGMGDNGTGPVIYRFTATDANDALEQTRQWREARGLNRLDVWLAHAENVPPEILRAAPPGAINDMTTPWTVWNINDPSFTVTATGATEQDAITDAMWNPINDIWTRGSNNSDEFRAIRAPLLNGARSEMIPPGLVPPGMPPSTPDGNWSLRNRNDSDTFGGADGVGPILYQFQADSNQQAFRVAGQYSNSLEIPRHRLWLSMTNEVPAEYRTQRGHFPDGIPPAGDANEDRTSTTGYWVVFNAANGSDLDNLALIPARTSQDAQLAYRQWYQTTGYMLGRDSIFYIRPGDDVDVSDARNRGLPMPPPMGSGSQTLEPSDPEGNWGIQAPNGQIVYRFVSHNATTLDARVSAWSDSTNSDVSNYRLVRVDPEEPDNSDDAGTTSPQWNIVDNDTGQLLHGFNGVPMNQAEANRIAADWLDRHGPEDADMTQVSVVPVPQLYPGALDHITNSAIRDIPIDIAQNFQEPPASWDSGAPSTPQGPDLVQQLDLSTSPTSLSGRWYIVNHNTGEVVHDFTLPTSANRDYAEQQARTWQRTTGFDDPIRVYAAD